MKTLVLTFVLTFFALNSFSTVRTWDGGGGDANWSTAANWVGDVAPLQNDDLVFPATSAQFTANNSSIFLANYNSITFDGSYTITGNPFRIGAGGLIINSGTQAINTSISLTAAQTFVANRADATATIVGVSLGSFGLTFDGPGTIGIGLISGSGSITKNGSGAAALISSFSYSGAITINDGIFVVDANIPGSAVTINSASTGGTFGLSGLGGTGTVGAVNVLQGGLSAGTLTSPTGILNISNGLTFTANGAYLCKIGGTTPGANGHDQLNVTGAVNLASARLGPLPWNGFRPAIGDSFMILKNDGSDAIGGTFLDAPEGAIFAGPLNTAFRITYTGGDGNDVVVTRVPRAPFDFDADGKSDVASFTQNGWYAHLSSNNKTVTTNLGTPTDVIVPADFDGDNRTDVAVYRPSQGTWYTLSSITSTVTIRNFGAAEDIPMPNDFDGDGRADLAIFRPSTGDWWIQRSLTGDVSARHFGTTGDKPLMADFDGDGIGDLAVYRPNGGEWYFLRSSDDSFAAFPFGIATDLPLPADYDGDGKTDAAVFRATADGTQPDFYILRSSDWGAEYISWGLPGDRPVVADYDGDGRSDIAVERPGASFAVWYMQQTTAGFQARVFENSITPVPAAYVR